MKILGLPIVAAGGALLLGNASGFVQNSGEGFSDCHRATTFLAMGYSYSSAQPFGDNAPNHQPGGGYRYSPSPEWEYLGSSIDKDAVDRLRPNSVPSGQFASTAQQSGAQGAGMPKPAAGTYGYSPCEAIGDNAAALARNYAHVAPSWEYQGPARNGQVGSIAEASRMLGMLGSGGASGGAALPPSAGTASAAFGGGTVSTTAFGGGASSTGATQSLPFGSSGGTASSTGSAGGMSTGATQSSPFGSSGGTAFGSSTATGTPGSAGGMGAGSSWGSSTTTGVPGQTGGVGAGSSFGATTTTGVPGSTGGIGSGSSAPTSSWPPS